MTVELTQSRQLQSFSGACSSLCTGNETFGIAELSAPPHACDSPFFVLVCEVEPGSGPAWENGLVSVSSRQCAGNQAAALSC